MNKFYAKFGGIETTIPWQRPDDDRIRRWRDDLSFDLTNWWVCGNVIEKHSPTWDVDIIYLNPHIPTLNRLSEVFSEMLMKGFTHQLLIDCAWVNHFYEKEWKPLKKIRPDNKFEKFWEGEWHRTNYQADVNQQIGEQLWYFEFNQPSVNWKKGIERNYKFNKIELNKF